ncbi:outer dynein arm-docking complex subunit 4 [Rhynchophorus ferrugineus]|uniref:outer dynein arm-docking complex subunit 4 n=1 Tax=Rhynchophorus ferrugineus TaxID=354439 RepID=UPI003FCC3AEC
MGEPPKSKAENRITRETELIQSFVRVSINEPSEEQKEEGEEVKEEGGNHGEAGGDRRIRQVPMSAETSRRLSKQITEDPSRRKGKRRRRRNLREEEIYCDKDRAAAVNLGSKDIKQSLKIKRKQDRSRILQIPEEADSSTFLALGNYEMCRGDIAIAVDFISKALELNPVEKQSLVARSKCYILLGQPEKALKDAESALQVDKGYMKAIYQKAEALYYLGDFEHSLMYYHRGLHIRPDHEGFKLGVHKAQKAIENAIGSIGRRPKSAGLISGETSITQSPSPKDVEDKNSTRRSTPFSQVRSKTSKPSRLLRELAPDKDYLDNLMKHPSIKCKFKENDDAIEKCIQETVQYLNDRQEFWRQQLPKHLK